MAPFRKRKAPSSRRPYPARARAAAKKGRTGYANVLTKSLNRRVNRLTRMIETKEITRTDLNQQLPHNNIYLSANNPFLCNQGTGDPMVQNEGNRIGDSITVKGLMIRGFVENAPQRSRVYYRIMLIKGAKGDTFSRASLFKNDSNNKMIDQINTERFTVVAQKIFSVETSNSAPITFTLSNGVPSSATPAGIGTRTFKMWIPGRKFGRDGVIQYENNNNAQVKFFDYRVCILAYDWFGTPQDSNNVGVLNEMYTKIYFKDA